MEIKKVMLLIFTAVLFFANIFAWQEVFALCDNNLNVWFLDVGQGDAIFIKTPDDRQIIIDGGPDSSVLSKLSDLMGFFDRKIDVVILSHPDLDHVQGLIEVLDKYKAEYIVQSGIEKDSDEFIAWQKVLEKQKNLGAKIINVKAGYLIELGDIEINVIFPLEDLLGQKMGEISNENSVVINMTYGQESFLFTGDIGINIEKKIIESGQDIDCEVLKVGHHGSKYSTSEDFLQAATPQVAIIEVGKNSYGHPTQEILQRLEKFGIQIFRTDIDGDIKIMSDGINLINNK